MDHLNIEIKAHCENPNSIRAILQKEKADFKGIDHQIDTYFNVPAGRLKLREGNIENRLIFYEREDLAGPKQSNVILVENDPKSKLKELLIKTNGIKTIVDKKREIYFIQNIKFHIDKVENLGSFVEIEAIDKNGTIGKEKLYEQCQQYMKKFNISEKNLLEKSYSDMLIEKQ